MTRPASTMAKCIFCGFKDFKLDGKCFQKHITMWCDVMLLNIDSLENKMTSVSSLLHPSHIDILVSGETKTNPLLVDNYFQIAGYNLIRRDRVEKSRRMHPYLREGYSCDSWKVDKLSNWTNHFQTACQTDLLPRKLFHYGFDNNALSLLRNYFTGRSQQTRLWTCFSDFADLLLGFPQGSILGPLLFIV